MKGFRFNCDECEEVSKDDKLNFNLIKRLRNFQWFVEANKLSLGSIFGELAIENQEGEEHLNRRIATVKTLTDCEFAVLSRKSFFEILERV